AVRPRTDVRGRGGSDAQDERGRERGGRRDAGHAWRGRNREIVDGDGDPGRHLEHQRAFERGAGRPSQLVACRGAAVLVSTRDPLTAAPGLGRLRVRAEAQAGGAEGPGGDLGREDEQSQGARHQWGLYAHSAPGPAATRARGSWAAPAPPAWARAR